MPTCIFFLSIGGSNACQLHPPHAHAVVRKLAECLDGVDLSSYRTGELIDLPPVRWLVPEILDEKPQRKRQPPETHRRD
jgi:hypothetical protein